jgi:CubicO group peptidase (beta-lactamase class C family)
MKLRLYVVLLLCLFITNWSLPAVAQSVPAALDQYIEKARKAWEVPGLSVAIVKDGKVVLSKGYGVKEAGKNEAVDGATLFAIASNTKAFVATAIGQLVSRGKLNWDDKVVDHLPYFALYDDYATRHATVEDLLCHRLGLGTFSGDLMWYKAELSAEDVVKKIKYVPQAYDFRNGYGYSNLMFITAGEVISKVTGVSWATYIDQHIIQELGMDRTIISTNYLARKGNFATPHKPDETGKNHPIDWVNWDNMGAAGGIISSSDDMARWLMMNLNEGKAGGKVILEKAQQNRIWTPRNNYILSENARKQTPGRHFSGYGLGYGLSDYYGNQIVSHSGGYDGMYSYVLMVPDQNLGVAVLTNSMKGIAPALSYYIINQYLKAESKDFSAEALARNNNNKGHYDDIAERKAARVMNTKPTLPLEKYTGTYWAGLPGKVIVTQKGNKLHFHFADNPKLSGELLHWHYDTWEIQWDETHAWFDFGTLQFKLDNNLKVTGLHFDVPNGDIFFDEVDLQKEEGE